MMRTQCNCTIYIGVCPPIAQLVERRTVVVVLHADILRSLVRIRLGGFFSFFFFSSFFLHTKHAGFF